ncbi:MAG: hypothetical protein ACREOG_00090 [Gemmatimonadaceae bacterium]
MLIKIKKGLDGPNVFICTRSDGSVTMQHQRQPFFAGHDLTHFAVETVLGYRGFYSLLAEGWSLDDFGPPWPRGRITLEAELSERIVGLMDVERASGVIMSAADANASMREHYARTGVTTQLPELSEDQLAAIRRRRGELLVQWAALPPGAAIELTFPR